MVTCARRGRRFALAVATALTTLGAVGTAVAPGAAPAQAADVVIDAKALAAPGLAGTNNWSCKPTAAHPRPLVLVHGTFQSGTAAWLAAAQAFVRRGFCVFALNYGTAPGVPGLYAIRHVADSASQLATFIDGVLAATGASQVDTLGHSQGGMMPRYYLRFLGGASKVHTHVALAPSNHGTTLSGLGTLAAGFPGGPQLVTRACPACNDQLIGSPFLTKLNDGGDTVPGVNYTVISTRKDLVVTPYTTQFLGGQNVTNVTVQDRCPVDISGHVTITADPVALVEALHALDPDNVGHANCFTRP
jgi:triacylglycerol esterase/lipase EstA (alpha/beta hydrolase family)